MPKPTVVAKPTLADADQVKAVRDLEQYCGSGLINEWTSDFIVSCNKRLLDDILWLTTRQRKALNDVIDNARQNSLI